MTTRFAIVATLALIASCAPLDRKRAWQLDVARDLAPAPFLVEQRFSGPVRKLKLRVHPQDDFATETIDWQRRLVRLLDKTNEALIPALGVELEIVEVVPWKSKVGTHLGTALDDLTRIDAGEDVDMVIGLVTALPMVTPSIHQLGAARLLGKHMVLRGMDDSMEFQAMRELLSRLDDDEREHLYRKRREHKEAMVFLHELGHLWGAIHDGANDSVMAPRYTWRACRLSSWNVGIIDRVLAGGDDAESRSKMLDGLAKYVSTSSGADWFSKDRAQLLTMLRSSPEKLAKATDETFDRQDAEPTEGEVVKAPPTIAPDDQAIKDATDSAKAGDFETAWSLAEPVLARRLEDRSLMSWACQLEGAIERRKESALTRCRAAAEASPLDPLSALMVAHLVSGDPTKAWPAILEADRRLAAQSISNATAYASLASLYRAIKAPTRALRAAEKADEDAMSETRGWAEGLWATTGLGPNSLLASEDEPEYFALRYEIDRLLSTRDLQGAVTANERLRKRFRELPGAEVALCDAHLRARKSQLARGYCFDATRLDPNNDHPLQVLGMIALGEGRPKLAIEPFERAVEVAPDKKPNWVLLHSAYRAGGYRAKAADLADRYEKKFGGPMPPH